MYYGVAGRFGPCRIPHSMRCSNRAVRPPDHGAKMPSNACPIVLTPRAFCRRPDVVSVVVTPLLIFVNRVKSAFTLGPPYRCRMKEEPGVAGASEAVIAVQLTTSDLRLNPVFLDGARSTSRRSSTLGKLTTRR